MMKKKSPREYGVPIQLGEPLETPLKRMLSPLHDSRYSIYLYHESEPHELGIFVYLPVYLQLMELGGINEAGGVLVGDYGTDNESFFIKVQAAVTSSAIEATEDELKFTHKAWEEIDNIISASFANKMIVGWYHTHVNCPAFMSSADMFIHHNFFNLPWQVALVINTKIKQFCFFKWNNKSLQKVHSFYIYHSKNEPMTTTLPLWQRI